MRGFGDSFGIRFDRITGAETSATKPAFASARKFH
jgi:hypothetical protein